MCEGTNSQAYNFVELFAGKGNVTAALREAGFFGVAFDYDYRGLYNNIFEPSGFAFLGSGSIYFTTFYKSWMLCFF